MKDYTLSEAKKICEEHRTCGDCPLKIVTSRGIGCVFCNIPSQWQNPIEPRDMIELPCKTPANADPWQISPYKWQVIWRGSYKICTGEFHTEEEADAFLAELKGGKA